MSITICDVHLNDKNKELTPLGNAEFPVACYEDDMQKEIVPLHWHTEYEYITATEGEVTLTLGMDTVSLAEGDSCFINSGRLHAVRSVSDQPSVLRSLIISPKFIGGTNDSCIWQALILPFSSDNSPAYIVMRENSDWQLSVRTLMLSAWDSIVNEFYDYENESRYRISKAMRLIVEHLPFDKQKNLFRESTLNEMKMLLSYIEKNYNREISNHDLMAQCSWSESVLLRNFHQIAGTSPSRYILQYRMEKVTEALLATDLKCRDIAFSCGFHDLSYFTKIFKRQFHMTPLTYRNIHRNRDHI